MASKTFGNQAPKISHLVHAGKGGLAGEIADLRSDVDAAFTKLESEGGLLRTVEWTDPPAADTDYFVVDRASSASADVIDSGEAEWQTVDELDPPRNVTITSTTHADIDAVDAVVTGQIRDENGDLIDQTDTITLTDGGGATDAGTKTFSTISNVAIEAQSGTGGVLDIGFGDIIGLPVPMKSRAGLLAPIREVEAGSVVTTGTFTTAAAQAPHGTYAPSTVPDAANDYSLTYEVDPS